MELTIKKTKDYDAFKYHPLNRPVSPAHVRDLVASIKRDNQLDINPIIVDFEGRILSGQHRYEAARSLGLPIYYIEKEIHDDYILLANQSQRRTSIEDAIEFYIATRDLAAYKLLKRAYAEFLMPYGAIVALIGESMGKCSQIINGTFELRDSMEEAEASLAKYRELRHLLQGMPFDYKTSYKSTHFCSALRKMMDNDEIDWGTFMSKIRIYWTMLDCGMPTVSKWYEQMLKIYNKRRRYKIGEEEFEE